MRKKRYLLGAMVLTAALAATGCGSGTPSGSQDAGNAGDQERSVSSSGSTDNEIDKNISCTLTLATWDVAAAKTFEDRKSVV